MQVLYIAHSSEQIYWRTAYALLSCLAVHGGRSPFELVLHTDAPDFFQPFRPYATILPLAAEEIRRWVEAAGGYRNIIKANVLSQMTQSFFFMDSDTVLLKPLPPLADKLGPGSSIMQEREFRLGARPEFAAVVADPDFPEFTADTWMYNSGIIGVDAANLDLIRSVPQRVLRLLGRHRVRTPEQLTDAACLLERTKIVEAPAQIYHYWQDKGFADGLIEQQVKTRGLAAAVELAAAGRGQALFPLGFRRNPMLYKWYMRFQAKWETLREPKQVADPLHQKGRL